MPLEPEETQGVPEEAPLSLSPHDPTQRVRPTSPDPLPSSFAPGAFKESQPGADAPSGDELTPGIPFDPRYKEPLEGLMFLGSSAVTFGFLGHEFVIRTLTQDEHLIAPLLIKKWAGTIGEPKAYVTAMVALCIVSVDGEGLPIPFEESKDEYAWAHMAFNHVKSRWFPYTIDHVYNQYQRLEAEVTRVLEAMGKASGSAA